VAAERDVERGVETVVFGGGAAGGCCRLLSASTREVDGGRHPSSDQPAGISDADLDVRRKDAEALFEVIVEVIRSVAGTTAVGGISGGQTDRKGGGVVEWLRMGLQDRGERRVAGNAMFARVCSR
jgi:hypothetical protein